MIGVLTGTVLTIIVSLVGLVALEWPYAAAFVVVLPVYAVAMRWYLRTGPQIYRAERAAMSARAQEIVESQRGHATVVGFGLGEPRHHRHDADSHRGDARGQHRCGSVGLVDDRLPVAIHQVVENHHLAALGSQQTDGVRADVSGSSGDEDRGSHE